MNLITLLKGALGELKTDGWTKGTLHNAKGQHCALGALEDVLRAEFGPGQVSADDEYYGFNEPSWFDNENSEAMRLLNRAQEILGMAAGEKYYNDIVSLNDAEDTKFEDVRGAFMRAIALAKSGKVPA